MFFLFAVPPLLETLGTVVLGTVAARIVNDAYDAVKDSANDKDDSDE